MSIESWKDEFLPIEAEDVSDDLDAIDHSLLKWEGLRQENLDRHGLTKTNGNAEIVNEEGLEAGEFSLFMGMNNCALCQMHYQTRPDEDEDDPFCDGDDDGYDEDLDELEYERFACRKCPLAQVRDGMPCDSDMEGDEDYDDNQELVSPWQIWTRTGNPKPMISWLKAAKALQKRENKERVA